MTTEEAVGGEIELWFAPGDEPSVDGAKEIETKVEEGWLQKKYQLKAQNLVIKGKVTKLVCSYNSLTSLDVRKNTKLEILYCNNNTLTSLDVSKNTKLTELYCSNNKLTSLDVSKNTELTVLSCRKNQLTSLDASGSTKLTVLKCYKNNLTFEKLTLPKLSKEGNLYFKYTSDGDSQKLIKAEVEEIEKKNWTVLQHKGGDWVNYPGE